MTPLILPAALALALAAGAAPQATLTLDEVLGQARARSLELRIAGERLAQAETLSRKAWSYYLPQVSIGASYTWSSEDVALELPTSFAIRQLVDASGHPVNYPNLPAQDPTRPISPQNPPGLPTSYLLYPLSTEELELQRRQQYGVQLEAQQALFAPQAWRAVQSAQRAREVARARVDATTQDVLFGAAQLYYGAASLREVIAVQERTLETWRRHEADAEQLVAHGAAPRLALLKARTDRARAEEDLIRSRNAYDSARQALATLLDRDADFEVARPPEPAGAGEDPEESALARPDVQAAARSAELARGQEQEVSARYLPSVGLTGQWRWASITGFTGRHEGWSVILGARWTIWDGGRREAEGTEADHRTREAEVALELSRNKARDEVRRARLDVGSARAAQRKAEEQSRLAAEALQHAQAAHAAGAATYLEVSDATSALQNAELARVTDGLAAQLAALRLARAAGVFER
jgi:outer membrane protein, multidrug efflux system